MFISIANLKGGVGKTTTAVFLAEVASERHGSALLVDADPQGSAMEWADTAAEGGSGLRSVVVSLPTPDLARRLTGISGGYPVTIIDTPPGHLPIVTAAARAAALVLVPCQPTLMDLDRIGSTLAVANDHGVPAAVVLTRARAGTRALVAALDALDAAGLPVLKTVVPQRELIAAAYGTRPGAKGLALYSDVLTELEAASAGLTGARR